MGTEIFVLIMIIMSGYAIGRTISQEDIFLEFRLWVEGKFYAPLEERLGQFNEETGEIEVLEHDGYKTNVWRPFAVLLGKLGDLLLCVKCLSAQSSLWLGLSYLIWGIISLNVLMILASVGFVYLVCDFASSWLQND